MSVLIGTPLDDTLAGDADSDNTILGDAADFLLSPGGNDHLTGGSNSTNLLSGEVGGDFQQDGGADVLIGGESSTNRMFGEAPGSFSAARGGHDVLTGGNDSVNTMSGDAGGDLEALLFHGVTPSFGGNDTLVGGARSANTMFGDATGSFVASIGGDDVLTGGNDSVNTMSGDAGGDLEPVPDRQLMRSFGGNDTLVGGEDSANTLFGDAAGTISASLGGDDTLVAGDGGTNTMIGDALVLADEGFGGSTGGDDLLVSGTGTDDMWGDAKQVLGDSVGGSDVFRFLPDSGNDFIHDFERGKDVIEVNASLLPPANFGTGTRLATFAPLAQSELGKLTIEERDANNDGTTDSIIHFDLENSVAVLGVTGLTSEDIVAAPGSSYVLFGRTSSPIGTRDKWLGSEGNSQANNTPGGGFRGSAFNADTATAAGTVLAGAGFADYLADGILTNANVAMFDLTESPLGVFASGAAADLETRIAASTPLFGSAKTDLDPAQSNVDAALGELHLAQTDADWNGIKNIEVSLDSTTSLRDIRLENFVDTRVKLGDTFPNPDAPVGDPFDIQLLGTKRGEVDASHAPAAIALALDIWTNTREFQNSFDIKGSVFDDVVNIGAGSVFGSTFGTPSNEFFDYFQGIYLGKFTKTFTNLGAGEDIFDSSNAVGDFLPVPFFQITDKVWAGTGDDVIHTDNGDDKLFGDNGWGANFYADPAHRQLTPGADGNDVLDAGDGADFLQGDGDRGAAVFAAGNVINIGASGGDQLFLGLVGFRSGPGPEDTFSDTVNYKFGDGFDVVRQFGDTAIHPFVGNDKVTFDSDGHTATVNEVNTSEGWSTWISTVEDPSHGVLVVGVTGLVIGTDIIFT